MEIEAVRTGSGGSTSYNQMALETFFNNRLVNKIIFFATKEEPDEAYNENKDGTVSNLPLFGTIIEVQSSPASCYYVVCDGMFLTAARQARYYEVRAIMNKAEALSNVYFITERVVFTSSLKPREAASKLLMYETKQFTPESRSEFFALVSLLPESSFH